MNQNHSLFHHIDLPYYFEIGTIMAHEFIDYIKKQLESLHNFPLIKYKYVKNPTEKCEIMIGCGFLPQICPFLIAFTQQFNENGNEGYALQEYRSYHSCLNHPNVQKTILKQRKNEIKLLKIHILQLMSDEYFQDRKYSLQKFIQALALKINKQPNFLTVLANQTVKDKIYNYLYQYIQALMEEDDQASQLQPPIKKKFQKEIDNFQYYYPKNKSTQTVNIKKTSKRRYKRRDKNMTNHQLQRILKKKPCKKWIL